MITKYVGYKRSIPVRNHVERNINRYRTKIGTHWFFQRLYDSSKDINRKTDSLEPTYEQFERP